MRYSIYRAKTAPASSLWLKSMIIMGILAMGLIIFDIHELGVIIYALSGIR